MFFSFIILGYVNKKSPEISGTFYTISYNANKSPLQDIQK